MKVIDLTHTYETGQLAGNPERHPSVKLTPMGKLEEAGCNTSSLLLGSHTGTHMDAPFHLIGNGDTIDCIDLTYCTGDVTVVDLRTFKSNESVQVSDLTDIRITSCMLFVFGWDKYFGTAKYSESWPYFTLDAIKHLVAHGLKLLVIDTLSPDRKATGSENDYEVHKYLFNHGVNIVEKITNTESVDFSKHYSIAALPLKLKNLDGSPCRVILIEK